MAKNGAGRAGAPGAVDANVEYAQQQQALMVADAVTFRLLTTQPLDPLAAIVSVLREGQRGALVAAPPRPPHDADAAEGKAYAQRHDVAGLLNEWIRAAFARKPDDFIEWSIGYFTILAGGGFAPGSDQARNAPPPRSSVGRGGSTTNTNAALENAAEADPAKPRRNLTPRICVIYYSAYGHSKALALAAAEGAREFEGADVVVRRVAETLSPEQVARQSIDRDETYPPATVSDIGTADGLIFAFGAKFGSAPAQVSALMDTTGGLWARNALNGKPAALCICTATQHGGHERAAVGFAASLMHHGMVFVGPTPQDLLLASTGDAAAPQGGSPWAAGTLSAPSGERQASPHELNMAQRLGFRIANLASRLTLPYR